MNNRRKLVVALGVGALGLRARSFAQRPTKIYRLGILTAGYTTSDLVGPRPAAPTLKAFLRGLSALGYVYGQHFMTEPRAGESKPERYAAVAAEVVRDQVDLIVAAGPWLPALKQATSDIPVVMAGAEDPLGQGLVRSLGRSGGNFTGLSNQSIELYRKRLELLKELVPTAGLVAVLRDPTGMGGWQVAEATARERGWKLLSLEVNSPGQIEGAFKAAKSARAGALLVIGGGIFFPQSQRVAELAIANQLPAIYASRPATDAGGLMSYGADLDDIWRRAATFVDKILKGTKPTDLPVEQPTKFELVINMKTAKALGIKIPNSILVRADKVIE
jgi:putative tryptophan/tyrosine transport system substrate-binding protein